MQRKLLFLERVMFGDGTAPFNGVFGVRIRGSFTQKNLVKALVKIQAKHPLLRAAIKLDPKGMPWYVTNDQVPPIPLRIVRRVSDDDWIHETETEGTIAFNAETGPMLRVVCIKSTQVSDLLIVGHHCLCDGGTVQSLMHDILALLDEPDAEIGISTTFSSIDELIPVAELKNKKRKIKIRLVGSIVRVLAGINSIFRSVKNKVDSIASSKNYLLHWKLGQREASALLRHCVTMKVTPNAALCVAFLTALEQHTTQTKFNNRIVCPVDIRRYVPEIKKDMMFAFGLGVSVSIDKKLNNDFWAKVKKLYTELADKMEKLNGYDFIMTLECFHPMIQKGHNGQGEAKVNYDLMFSNLGRIDIPKSYNSFEVETVHSPAVIGRSCNTNTILTTTYRGEMNFSFIASEAYLPYEKAMKIKNTAMQLLIDNLPLPQAEEQAQPTDRKKILNNVDLHTVNLNITQAFVNNLKK